MGAIDGGAETLRPGEGSRVGPTECSGVRVFIDVRSGTQTVLILALNEESCCPLRGVCRLILQLLFFIGCVIGAAGCRFICVTQRHRGDGPLRVDVAHGAAR